MRHLFPLVVSYNRFVELEKEVVIPLALFIKKGIAWKMHGHKFRRQHSSESMQEPKDTYS